MGISEIWFGAKTLVDTK